MKKMRMGHGTCPLKGAWHLGMCLILVQGLVASAIRGVAWSAESAVPGVEKTQVQALMDQAAQYRSLGRTQEAIQAYEEARRLDPANPVIHRNLGVLFFESDQWAEAETSLKESLGLANDDPYTYLYLGRLALKEEEFTQARLYFQKSLAVNPNLAETHLYYGLLETKEEKFEAARREYEIAKSIAPQDPRSYVGLGNLHYRTKNFPAAVEAFETALSIDPSNTEAHNGLGVSYFELGDLARARASFEEALSINPRDTTALNNLGVLFEKQGRVNEAQRAFQQAVEADPENEQARTNLDQLTWFERQRSYRAFPPDAARRNAFGEGAFGIFGQEEENASQSAFGDQSMPLSFRFPVYSSGGAPQAFSSSQDAQSQGSGSLMQIGGALLTQFLVNKLARKRDEETQ